MAKKELPPGLGPQGVEDIGREKGFPRWKGEAPAKAPLPSPLSPPENPEVLFTGGGGYSEGDHPRKGGRQERERDYWERCYLPFLQEPSLFKFSSFFRRGLEALY